MKTLGWKLGNNVFFTKWTFIILLIIIFTGLIIIINDILFAILCFIILAILAMAFVKFEILHPFTWYIPFFVLYSISYPFLVYIGEKPDLGYTFYTLLLEWLGLITFIIVVGPKMEVIDKNINYSSLINTILVLRIALTITFLFTCSYTFYILTSGLSSKYEISLSNSVYVKLGSFFPILILIHSLYISNRILLKKVLPLKSIILMAGWMLFSFLVSGERDFVYRYIWMVFFLLDTIYKRIPRKYLVTIGLIGIFTVPILGDLKNIFVTDKDITFILPDLTEILSNEFISASRNLQVLVAAHPSVWQFFMGETLWWSIKRVFILGFLSNVKITNSVGWFNNTFYFPLVSRGGGRGFTLVGEGYMNFGVVGVIIWFAILGLIVRLMYKKSSKNILYLVSYIIFMPNVVYSIRADFSNLFSPLLKQIIIPIVIIKLVKSILIKSLRKPNLYASNNHHL